VDNTRWSGLTQGKLRPERTLDLHGMTLARAHAATRAFIDAAVRDQCRVVEIVTGVGERGEGKIRREFMHWINAPDLRARVLALAHPHRANAGAVRLLLRRPKRG
jgi:DNA-nicking Smr family endonuclease